MATARRKKTQGGQEIIEFALMAIFYVPMFLGTFVVGMNLVRSIECNTVVRDVDDMFIHGADFSTYGYQQQAETLSSGLNLQSPSFTGNSRTNTGTSGNGIMTLTEIMYIGPTTGTNCQSVSPATCTNANKFVYIKQVQFGNSTLVNSNTVQMGSPSGATFTSDGTGTVLNYVTDTHAALTTSAQSAMQAMWEVTNATTGQVPLVDGQVVYVTEAYFQSPDLSFSSLSGGGVYAINFF